MTQFLNEYRKSLTKSQLFLTNITEQPIQTPDRCRLVGETTKISPPDKGPTISANTRGPQREYSEAELELISRQDEYRAAQVFFGPMWNVVTEIFTGGTKTQKDLIDYAIDIFKGKAKEQVDEYILDNLVKPGDNTSKEQEATPGSPVNQEEHPPSLKPDLAREVIIEKLDSRFHISEAFEHTRPEPTPMRGDLIGGGKQMYA
ncbi:hypothetical protein [Vibrio owensii]|uniref:hypothetical protein n=1 Tax=Vibrio owensii TaxID=696485 RepID=UPI000996C304|nr:hypothetical protein [Vibrio owensii]AQW56628.1 hypothetical protein A9237_00290 [Vibrio owensii]